MPRNWVIALLCLMSAWSSESAGQSVNTTANNMPNFQVRVFARISKECARLDRQLNRQTEKYLRKMAKQEADLKNKLSKVDSNAARRLFANSDVQYAILLQNLRNDSAIRKRAALTGSYIPYADSMTVSMKFLQANPQLLAKENPQTQQEIRHSLEGLEQLQSDMQYTDQIKQILQQRRRQISQCLSQYSQLPIGLSSAYRSYSQEYYYYSQQIRQYKELLNDPDKMVKGALSLLAKMPAFNEFMAKNSELAGLFGIPAGFGTPQSIAGLPTSGQVQQLIQSQLGKTMDAQKAVDQNIQSAQSALDDLKSKLGKYGQGAGDVDLPDFQQNTQKTKSFWRRLEYGTNMQTQHGNFFFPTTTDLGLSLGYKLNDKNTIGLGASYKVGWGSDIYHIGITGQGVSLRSFIDVKIKGSISATGGFEYNYQQPFTGLLLPHEAARLDAWQKSGLIGLTKTVSLRSKVFKKTQAQLLWDFLSYMQSPPAQPIKFRVAYNF